jgi:hypothetical protein
MFSGQTVIMKIMGGMTYDEDSVSLSLSRENCPPFIFEQEGDWSEWQYRLVDSGGVWLWWSGAVVKKIMRREKDPSDVVVTSERRAVVNAWRERERRNPPPPTMDRNL